MKVRDFLAHTFLAVLCLTRETVIEDIYIHIRIRPRSEGEKSFMRSNRPQSDSNGFVRVPGTMMTAIYNTICRLGYSVGIRVGMRVIDM